MGRIVKKSTAPIYGVGLVWLIWALVLPLYAAWHFLLAIALSAAVFVTLRKLRPDRVIVVPDPEPEPQSTGNPEIDALIAERDRALAEMRRLNSSIQDETISGQIDRLEALTGKIIGHVVEHPQKLHQIRRFLQYYLPTTLKLLNAYDRMDAAGVAGQNVDGAMGKIETILEKICDAFEKQLDALFGDEALDISTDITVLEQMLAREGIGGTQMPGV